jgi:hypothetical protein
MKKVVFHLGMTTWCRFAEYHHQRHICRASVHVLLGCGSRTEDEKFDARRFSKRRVGLKLGGFMMLSASETIIEEQSDSDHDTTADVDASVDANMHMLDTQEEVNINLT